MGLATYLLGIANEAQVSRDPLRGNLVENLIILELMKARLNRGLDPQLYFYRDVQQREVDLIFVDGHDLVPVEIKSSKTFHPEFLKSLLFFQELVGKRAQKGYLIYAGEQEQQIHAIQLLNYKRASQVFNC